MVFIRTDANEIIATGHLMRCYSISEKLKEMGEKVVFVFKDKQSVEVLPDLEYILLKEHKGSILQEIPQIIELLEKENQPKILLDLYEFTADYMKKLKPYAKIITFDDMFAEKFPADAVINYNLYYNKFNYYLRYKNTKVKLLLGGSYVPLRNIFQNITPVKRKEVKTVLLICGGSDRYHILLEMLRYFCHMHLQERYHFIIVAGAMNPDIEQLEAYQRKNENIAVYKNVKDMATLMQRADLVVSAASTVLYECCCILVPTVFFTIAENQENDTEIFSENQRMLYAGDVRKNKEAVIQKVAELIERIADDKQLRENMLRKMKGVIDGKGAERIAEEIVMLSRRI